jgi:hypothetical protein
MCQYIALAIYNVCCNAVSHESAACRPLGHCTRNPLLEANPLSRAPSTFSKLELFHRMGRCIQVHEGEPASGWLGAQECAHGWPRHNLKGCSQGTIDTAHAACRRVQALRVHTA